MSGCGNNCSPEQQARCANRGASCGEPRSQARLVEAIAQVIADNRLAMKAVEIYASGIGATKEEAVTLARLQLEQENG